MSGKREILSAFALHKNSAFEIHATENNFLEAAESFIVV